MTNDQYSMARRSVALVVHWSLVIGHCLLLAACGGNSGNSADNSPKAASLSGDRNDDGFDATTPAIDVSGAPTDSHKQLGKLIPTEKSLIKNSIEYAGWDSANAQLSGEAPEDASIPVVYSEYKSTGFDIMTDGGEEMTAKRQDYPQECRLYLIEAPEASAAEVIANDIRAKLTSRQFSQIDSLALTTGLGKEKQHPIERFTLVTDQGDHDKVYVAYVKIIGNVVVYALETEQASKLPGPDGAQISRVLDGGIGSRVGATLISLIVLRATS